ncbi:hypothetical protein KKD19_02720 [Patescibacteria group bacterium]|nr:hypothetical protein [Patescibacteria group bacterium]MCG2692510.1 hypothetical protein [Candidatus Parcubacteria bacterium]
MTKITKVKTIGVPVGFRVGSGNASEALVEACEELDTIYADGANTGATRIEDQFIEFAGNYTHSALGIWKDVGVIVRRIIYEE